MVKFDVIKSIKRIRKAKGWSQERFAKELGVTFATVNRWENGKRKPLPMAMKIIEKLEKRIGSH